MKRFEMRDVMYFGLYAVAFVLLLMNAVHAGKERKAYREKMDVIEAKLDELASSTDARLDGIEQKMASDTDALQEEIDTIREDFQKEVERIDKKIKEVEEAKQKQKEQEQEAVYAASASYVADSGSGYDHPFRSQGTTEKDGFTYTWYSQRVLPGGGLSIPDRHVNQDGFVVDGDGNICVASDDLDFGTEVDTPYGKGKVYDTGSGSGNLDLYTDW